jgi:hypothetical protein
MKLKGHVARITRAYIILVAQPEWKRPYARSKSMESDIKLYLVAKVFEDMNWIHVTHDRVNAGFCERSH